jgi:hypothetical protein
MTDDEAICVALLHGPGFDGPFRGPFRDHEGDERRFMVVSPADVNGWHPIEHANKDPDTAVRAFPSRAAIAQAYCKHYNIGW